MIETDRLHQSFITMCSNMESMDDISFLFFSFLFKDQEIIKRVDMKQEFMAGNSMEDLDKEEQLSQRLILNQTTHKVSVS